MKYTKPIAEVVEVAVSHDIILGSVDFDFLPEFTLPSETEMTFFKEKE
ncbi:MAG: hypothetical protein IJA60_02380 [Clostridia bacterium]|nr:hypothetical protein [Clostridia bacterium]